MTTKDELIQNWFILFIAVMCMILAFSGPAFSMPFIYSSVINEFGWDREQVTLLATAKYAIGSFVAIAVGRFIDGVGPKKILIGVSMAGVLALSSFTYTANLTMYYAAGFLLGVATTGTMVAMKVMISKVFEFAQGTAMGIVMMGASAGAVLVPLVVAPMISNFGWRAAMLYMALAILFIAIPLLVFGLTEERMGDSNKKTADRSASQQAQDAENKVSLAVLFREPRFYLICVAVFFAGMVDQSIIQHQNLYFELDLGIATTSIALAISFYGAAGIVGRLLLGYTFDKLSVKGIAIGYSTLVITSMMAIALAYTPGGIMFLGMMILFMSLRGIAHAAVLLDSAVLAKHCYGKHNLGIIIGILTAVINVGFALGPWLMGRIYTLFGSYQPALLLYSLLAVVSIVAVLMVKPTHWLAARQSGREQTPAVATAATPATQ